MQECTVFFEEALAVGFCLASLANPALVVQRAVRTGWVTPQLHLGEDQVAAEGNIDLSSSAEGPDLLEMVPIITSLAFEQTRRVGQY